MLRKIKVIHCVESWLPQTATWLYSQVTSLPVNVENHIVCHSVQNLEQFEVPNIYSLDHLPTWRQYLNKINWKLRIRHYLKSHLPLLDSVVRSVKPDILHSHFGHIGAINAKLAKKYSLKHIVHFYGADINYVPNTNPRWLTKYKKMSDLVDQVLCEGPFMAESIASLGIQANKIKVYRLGIDLKKIRFEPRCHQRGEKLRFLIVGSFREKKGIPYALDALGLFQRINENIEITTIGDAGHQQREKDEKEKIFKKIKQWNLQDKVRFLGYQPYDILLKEAYEHHIFISPSVESGDGDNEGGAPVTIIEMAASGMPIISTNHCDIPYVLSKKNSKYLVGERDSQALCEAIENLIESNWDDLVKSNRHFIEQELDVRKQAKKLYQIYLDICSYP